MLKYIDISKTKILYSENELFFMIHWKCVTENILKVDIRVLLFYYIIIKIV